MRLPLAFRALAHRNYRLFVVGQGVSLTGTWMQQTGMSWLVYDMTESPFMLGAVAFCGQIPAFFLAPVAGVFSDQLDRRRTLLATQAVSMLQALLLVALMWGARLEIWQLIALSAVLGVANAFDMPTRQAFLIDMAPSRDDLPNAIALNSSMVNLTRLIGPLLGGLAIAVGGVMACFVANAVSYVAVIAALGAMRDLPRRPRPAEKFGFGMASRGLVEGFAYAFGFAPIRALLLLVAMQSLLGMPVTTLLPVFARDILRGDATIYGLLGGASGVGALAAALYLAQRRSVVGLGRPIAWAAGVFGAGMILFSLSQSVILSVCVLAVTGYSMMLLLAGCNTLLQTLTDDDKRGRVISLYAMAFMGTVPVGNLIAGTLASTFGAANAARISGCGCILGALVFAWRLPRLRQQAWPIYERAGLAPSARQAAALETAAELQAPPQRMA
ncbi:MAG: MFS transporter [Planctomycetota bacterium]|nr:MAG: MFS transporter [Planctomycetota bacterium]